MRYMFKKMPSNINFAPIAKINVKNRCWIHSIQCIERVVIEDIFSAFSSVLRVFSTFGYFLSFISASLPEGATIARGSQRGFQKIWLRGRSLSPQIEHPLINFTKANRSFCGYFSRHSNQNFTHFFTKTSCNVHAI